MMPRPAWRNAEAATALARYEAVVRAAARRLAPAARSAHGLDEEDLRAEGRVAVLEALRSYGGFGIEEQVWVRTRVRQRMIDALRRLSVRIRKPVHPPVQRATEREGMGVRWLVSLDVLDGESGPGPHDAAPLADELAEESSRQLQLRHAIAALPVRQREAIQLGLFEGLLLREIGDRMGISESRACQLQKRAVQALQRAVSGAASAA
jgi:RNA polymerase sigma factor FliA